MIGKASPLVMPKVQVSTGVNVDGGSGLDFNSPGAAYDWTGRVVRADAATWSPLPLAWIPENVGFGLSASDWDASFGGMFFYQPAKLQALRLPRCVVINQYTTRDDVTGLAGAVSILLRQLQAGDVNVMTLGPMIVPYPLLPAFFAPLPATGWTAATDTVTGGSFTQYAAVNDTANWVGGEVLFVVPWDLASSGRYVNDTTFTTLPNILAADVAALKLAAPRFAKFGLRVVLTNTGGTAGPAAAASRAAIAQGLSQCGPVDADTIDCTAGANPGGLAAAISGFFNLA